MVYGLYVVTVTLLVLGAFGAARAAVREDWTQLGGAVGILLVAAGSAFANLITHLRKLQDADYLSTEKTGNGPASRTSVALTHRGRAALEAYAGTLRRLLDGV